MPLLVWVSPGMSSAILMSRHKAAELSRILGAAMEGWLSGWLSTVIARADPEGVQYLWPVGHRSHEGFAAVAGLNLAWETPGCLERWNRGETAMGPWAGKGPEENLTFHSHALLYPAGQPGPEVLDLGLFRSEPGSCLFQPGTRLRLLTTQSMHVPSPWPIRHFIFQDLSAKDRSFVRR